jgi:hypothetical protein
MEAHLVDSEGPGSQVTAVTRRRESSLMHTVNSNLRQRSEAVDTSESIAFFCECQTPTCYAPVWLSAADFDTAVARDAGWLLLAGHLPSALWHRREPLPTRRTARDASVLRRRSTAFGTDSVTL